MTVSEHAYSAVLIGSPDRPLSVLGGSITLDAGRAPHVTAQLDVAMPGHYEWIEVGAGDGYGEGGYGEGGYGGALYLPEWVPDADLLADLDPREACRIRVTATLGGVSREFDLGLRDREVRHADGALSLSLASDEAILEDFRPLADDPAPLDYQTSLRSVVEYVLGAASPGETLAASPALDADATRYWSVTSMLLNPSAEGTLDPWTAAGNCTLFHSTAARTGTNSCGFTSVAAGVLAVTPMALTGKTSVTAGKSYVFNGYGRRFGATARTIQAVIRWVNADGATPWSDVEGTPVALTDTDWTARATVIGIAPAGAVAAFMFFRITGSTAAGQIGYIDDAMFYEGDAIVPPFTGASTDDAGYDYAWTGDANASTSTRTPLNEAPYEALIWRAGQSAMDFLAPLVQVAGFRLVCDEAREWTLRDERYAAAGSLSIRHAVNLIDGTDSISRDADLFFDAAVTTYEWTDRDGIQQRRVDSYALPGATRVRHFERTTAYPGPGFSEYAVRRAQGRGREVTATSVADWTAHAEQPATVVLDGAPTQVGNTQSVSYDLNTDRMSITLRTLEIPEGSVDLLGGNVNALAGTVNAL